MSVRTMSLVFEYNMPELKTDDGRTVPDSTAKFVLLALADHCNDDGEGAYIGVKRICKKTCFSSQTVCNALNALRHNGYTTLEGKSKVDTNNYTINLNLLSQPLGFQPLESDDSSHQNSEIPAARVKPSINHQVNHHRGVLSEKDIKQANAKVDAMIKNAQPNEPALDDFERSLGFGELPWYSSSTWEKFRRFVVRVSASDPTIWKDYAAWRQDGGKYKAFSNRKIRENPAAFMDTGYPEYEASKMYRRDVHVDGSALAALMGD